MPQTMTVEVMIRNAVYEAALARARTQAQKLRGVAREILFERAAQVQPGTDEGHPAPRMLSLSQPKRRRLRFPVDRDEYEPARDRLHASGVSVTAAIEDGLERFARTGEFKEII